MYKKADSLDDLLRRVFPAVLSSRVRGTSTKGKWREMFGVLLVLTNPRARLSRSESRRLVFGCIGELLWYLSGSDRVEFIRHFIPRYAEFAETDGHVHGAYGPRLFDKDGINQIEFVLGRLKEKPTSRQAVIQLYDTRDTLKEYKDVPCTCTLQFVARSGKLHLHTHMRSNDAFVGLPHDIFCFTMLQEMMAVSLGLKLGWYSHSVASLHIYEDDVPKVAAFMDEDFQDKIAMPEMPGIDPFQQVKTLLAAEPKIRAGNFEEIDFDGLVPYWADIGRLVRIHSGKILRGPSTEWVKEVALIKKDMDSKSYDSFIRHKTRRLPDPRPMPDTAQISLPNMLR